MKHESGQSLCPETACAVVFRNGQFKKATQISGSSKSVNHWQSGTLKQKLRQSEYESASVTSSSKLPSAQEPSM